MSKWRKFIFNFTILGGIQYVVVTIIAMLFYSGGSKSNPANTTYLWSENFLSDLGRMSTFTGESNIIPSYLYCITLSITGISAICLFFLVWELYKRQNSHRILTSLMLFLGILAGGHLIGIAWSPSDTKPIPHGASVMGAFLFLFLALSLLMITIYRTSYYPNIYAHVLGIASFSLLGYLGLMFIVKNPNIDFDGLTLHVVGQKIVVYMLILSLSIQGLGLKKVWKEIFHKESAT